MNLSPPPGFRGLDEHLPLTMYTRHLPHWRQEGATYFVTFRLADALPQIVVRQLQELHREWELKHREPRAKQDWEQLQFALAAHMEDCLDKGYGACHFRNPQFAQLLANALVHFNGVRHETSCYVVMPNHCHVIMRPLAEFTLEKILQGIKGFVARSINRSLGQHETFWQEESYDRIVRDEEHLYRAIQYIGRNPAMARLDRGHSLRWLDPRWRDAGRGFEDDAVHKNSATQL